MDEQARLTIGETPGFAPALPTTEDKYTIQRWDVENPTFWESTGKKIALRNLAFSIFAEFLAFSVWQVWSAVAVNLPAIGFKFSLNQLFWLAAVPGITGATLRLPYAFMVPKMGGRNWTLVSTALLLLPTLGIGLAVQNPETPYWMFLVLALLCGFGGGNFASSMANINYFFPKRMKGFALGLNAAGGNVGVSVVQFAVPIVITMSIFGQLGGASESMLKGTVKSDAWIQNAGFMWVPLILLALVTTWFFQNNLLVARASFREQFKMFKDKHAWLMSVLYLGTFGSFIGYSAGFPLLIKSQFPGINPLQYAFLGPLVGSLVRPLGGWLPDKLGGARVTFWNFCVMILAVSGVIYFLGIRTEPGAFAGFFTMFIILFVATGIGNGSTYRMIPIIYMTKNNARGGAAGTVDQTAMNVANKQSGSVVGITAAFAAYGAFFIPKGYGTSIELTGGPTAALVGFVMFYTICVAITFWFYKRKHAEIPC